MRDITLVLLSAGNSTRFGMRVKKQWLYQGDNPLWLKVAKDFQKSFDFKEIVIVSAEDELEYVSKFAEYRFVAGGSSRQESLSNALKIIDSKWVLVSDVARCCIDKNFSKEYLKV